MSFPMRSIDVDPETPIQEIVALLEKPGDAIEVRFEDQCLVFRLLDDQPDTTDAATTEPGPLPTNEQPDNPGTEPATR